MANVDIFENLVITTNKDGVTTMSVAGAFGMNLPGFDFHQLKGFTPLRYTVHLGA